MAFRISPVRGAEKQQSPRSGRKLTLLAGGGALAAGGRREPPESEDSDEVCTYERRALIGTDRDRCAE